MRSAFLMLWLLSAALGCGRSRLQLGDALPGAGSFGGIRDGGATSGSGGSGASGGGSGGSRAGSGGGSGTSPPPPPPPVCGNGTVESGEQCDGPANVSCAQVGFGAGRVGCAGCQFDVSACTPAPPLCSPSVPTSLPPACVSSLCMCDPMGLAACDSDCFARLECALRACGADGIDDRCALAACPGWSPGQALALQLGKCARGNVLCSGVQPPVPTCGNGVIDGETRERCEIGNLLGQTCQSRGFDFGTLACDPRTCQLDTSGCGFGPSCGNGVVELEAESCDGGDLAGQSCRSLGLGRGTLRCSPGCSFDTRDCRLCGDGRVHANEACDGTRLQGQSCVSLGYSGGALGCHGDCSFDVGSCALCGDGSVGPGENCDGANLLGQSCASLGLGTGALACSAASCHYDTRNCDTGAGFCGNGIAEADEQCDGMDLVSHDCASLGFGFDSGSLGCNQATCRYDLSGCGRSSGPMCLNRCIDGNCAALIETCDRSPDCHQVLDCLDGCIQDASLDCTARCIVGVPNGATIAIVAADCVADCALECR
jgi:hypothetical protein